MKNMVDYHDHYLKKDVSLLADVFEKFYKFYKLHQSHYFSSPGLSWDGILKMTRIKFELVSDINKHLFIEKGLRGRISYICKRKQITNNKANNKYMKNYDPTKESKFIMYLDESSLYGWGMSQYLPCCKIEVLKIY